MPNRLKLRYVLLSLLLDIGSVLGAMAIANYLRQTLPYGAVLYNPLYPEGIPPLRVYALVAGLWVLTALALSLYDPKKTYKAVDEYQTLTLTVGFFAMAVAGTLYFTYRQTSRLLMLYALGLTLMMTMAWRTVNRVIARTQRKRPQQASRVLIVGAGDVGRHVASLISEHHWAGMTLVGYLDDDLAKHGNGLPVLGTLDEVESVVRSQAIDNVILALPPQAHARLNLTVSRLHKLPVRVRIVPDYFSLALYRATVDDFGGIPMINLRDPALSPYQRLTKRALDVVVGGLLTVAFLPLMGVIAIAIRLNSDGPILFRQPRVGENGEIFRMLKFRSMVANAEVLQREVNGVDEAGHVIHKHEDDPRVTRVGRFIRRWSLDELPQFFNVLKGDMSLIGPRPELPWLVDRYEPWQRARFAVPQGLTGWWQVNGRSDKMMHLHTDEDLYYIQNYSLWLDLFILLKTPWVILRGKGAF
jgi:exopolysaccharide biosynthesis polyprenyl glycosylphosphotransferase